VASRPGRSLLLSGAVAHPRRVPAGAARQLVRAYALAPDFVRVNDAMRAGRFEGLERIRCPVTLVWPEHDRLIRRPVWVPDRVRNVVLSDAGHMPMWDAPEALAEVLIEASGGKAGDPAPPPSREQELAGETS
jgi:pimeloyl-ACP methyl ester carboxylesterase